MFAFVGIAEIVPLLVFGGFVFGVWSVLSLISNRNSRAQDRLDRISRPASLAEIEEPKQKKERFQGVMETAKALSAPLMPKTELETARCEIRLANAGFRSESAVIGLSRPALRLLYSAEPDRRGDLPAQVWPDADGAEADRRVLSGVGFYLPTLILWYLRTKRQEAIFLSLPDALDLLVVCVESGLGLDAAMRKVCDEMKDHAKVICEEFSLANFQLQMGRPRREVLHDLGVRTGVDDVRSLAAILIQADRFGSSIAQALRVQSDSMRTRRKQLAEEKAAKTAVQLIFPLVLFIFPGIFVVLVGPAAISIMNVMMKQ